MRQSLGWRIFALTVAAIVLPFGFATLFRSPPPKQALHGFIDSIAMIGLIGYAFGVRFGSSKFWRVFAAVFALFYVHNFFGGLPRMIGMMIRSDYPILLRLFFLPIVGGITAAMLFWALALFRYGGWLSLPMPRTAGVQPQLPIARIVPARS